MAKKQNIQETPTIHFTHSQFRDFAKRCMTMGRDVAIASMNEIRGRAILSEDLTRTVVGMEQSEVVFDVVQRLFIVNFNEVLDDPISALWQREFAETMAKLQVIADIRNQL